MRASRNSGMHTGVQMRYQDGVWLKEDYYIFGGIFLLDTLKGPLPSWSRVRKLVWLDRLQRKIRRRMQHGRVPGDRQLPLLLFTVYKYLPTARGNTCRNCTIDRLARLASQLPLDLSSDYECGKSRKRMNIIPGRKLNIDLGKRFLHIIQGVSVHRTKRLRGST